MKDETPAPRTSDLPPCPLTHYCQCFIDELYQYSGSYWKEYFVENLQNERLMEKLCTHILTCPTCTTALTQARRVRLQQRRALREVLNEGEQKVPSTTEQTLIALRSWQKSLQKTPAGTNNSNHRK